MIIFHPFYYVIGWPLAHVYHALGSLFDAAGEQWLFTFFVLGFIFWFGLAPLHARKVHTVRILKAIEPQIEELRRRYADDRSQLNALTFRVYQKYGVNPPSGLIRLLVNLILLFSVYGFFQIISRPGLGYYNSVFGMPRAVIQSFAGARVFGVPITARLFNGDIYAPPHNRPLIILSILIGTGVTVLNIGLTRHRGGEIGSSTVPAIGFTLVLGVWAIGWPLALIWQITAANTFSTLTLAIMSARPERRERSVKIRSRLPTAYEEPITEQAAFGAAIRTMVYGRWSLWIQVASLAVALPAAILAVLALLH
jgi:membrane protein insertase Oxa1/YidC/SpoIIIJ